MKELMKKMGTGVLLRHYNLFYAKKIKNGDDIDRYYFVRDWADYAKEKINTMGADGFITSLASFDYSKSMFMESSYGYIMSINDKDFVENLAEDKDFVEYLEGIALVGLLLVSH